MFEIPTVTSISQN